MKTLNSRITDMLINTGIQPHLSGFDYLRTAVALGYDDKDYVYKMTKKLYPELAKEYNTTPPRVERCIRHAIEQAFVIMDIHVMEKIFGNLTDFNKGKVTNATFIAVLIERLKQQDEEINMEVVSNV